MSSSNRGEGARLSPVASALSRRARELQQSESPFGAVTLPSPSSLSRDQPAQSDFAVDNTIRRPRAGTLPSTFHLGSSSTDAALRQLQSGLGILSSGGTTSLPDSGINTPNSGSPYTGLRSSPTQSSIAASRLRSGSLTLPSSFGPSVWSQGWGIPAGASSLSAESGRGAGLHGSALSSERSHGSSSYGDDSHVRTLDYLGLDGDSPIGAGHFGEQRAQATPSSSSFGNARSDFLNGRVRSNTVATFPRTVESFRSVLPPPFSTSDGDEEFRGDSNSSYHRSQSSVDGSQMRFSATASEDRDQPMQLSSSRARAATIGILDETREVYSRRRAGTTAGITAHAASKGRAQSGLLTGTLPSDPTTDYSSGVSLTRGMGDLNMGTEAVSTWNNKSPSLSPDLVSHTPPPQHPSRSLWISNLHPSTSQAEIEAMFAPYGPIEGLHSLPEKECAFVTFYSLADAIHAKQDVLERLASQLTKGVSTIRIGFNPLEPSGGSPEGLVQGGAMFGGMDLQSSPTRALWVGSIPGTTTPSLLLGIFSPFGPIESARVLSHKSCGFINFERVEDAISARRALNNRELLGSEVGGIRIGFAKVPAKVVPEPLVYGGPPMIHQSPVNFSNGPQFAGGQEEGGAGAMATSVGSDEEVKQLLRDLGGDQAATEAFIAAMPSSPKHSLYLSTLPMLPPSRQYSNAEAPRLRDLKKSIETASSIEESDAIACDLVEECVSLASDYIGNTLIQKIFEKASIVGRMALLQRIAPHLAVIGTHKNGTWAVQKIIQCAQEEEEFQLITSNLTAATPPLLLNDFGNYVVQGALRFGAPSSDFIFDALVDRCWEIASARFGARSARGILESPLASRMQIKRVAVAVIINAIPLVTNPNGVLLITWLLDTSNLPGRYRILAPRFVPYLGTLCTHKLASLAVLKIINQRVDSDASKTILDVLFGADLAVLEEILSEQLHGSAFLAKLLSSPSLDAEQRASMVTKCRSIVTKLRIQSTPAYRKLFEELGLPFLGASPQQLSSAFQKPPPFQQPYQGYPGSGAPQWAAQQGGYGGGYPQQFDYNYPMGYSPYAPPNSSFAYYGAPPPQFFNPSNQGGPSPSMMPPPVPISTPSSFVPTPNYLSTSASPGRTVAGNFGPPFFRAGQSGYGEPSPAMLRPDTSSFIDFPPPSPAASKM